MINLIPPVVRKAVITEYWVRTISVWLLICSVVNIVVFLFALPVYVIVSSQVEYYAQSAEQAAKRVEDYDLSAGALVRANVAAQKVFELREVENFSEVVTLIQSLAGNDIALNGFVLGRSEGFLAPVIVSGQAKTRQALSGFREILLRQDNVSEVILPISNLAKDKNIDFSITVTLKKKAN